MRQQLLALGIGVGIFFLFVFFSYLVSEEMFTQFDFNTTVRLQDNIPRRVDRYFSWFSLFGNFEVMLIVLGFLLLAFRKIWGGLITLFLFGMFHVIEIFGKFALDHPPPPQFMLRTEHLVNFPQFYIRSESSYPSGHSGRTLFIAVLLVYFLYKSTLPLPVKVVLWGVIAGFVAIMLLSRVYLGEHWTSDVVGGALLGLSLGLISVAFLQKASFTGKKK